MGRTLPPSPSSPPWRASAEKSTLISSSLLPPPRTRKWGQEYICCDEGLHEQTLRILWQRSIRNNKAGGPGASGRRIGGFDQSDRTGRNLREVGYQRAITLEGRFLPPGVKEIFLIYKTTLILFILSTLYPTSSIYNAHHHASCRCCCCCRSLHGRSYSLLTILHSSWPSIYGRHFSTSLLWNRRHFSFKRIIAPQQNFLLSSDDSSDGHLLLFMIKI